MAKKAKINEVEFNKLSREEQLQALNKMSPKDRKSFEKDLKPEEKKEPMSDNDFGTKT